MSEFGIIDFRDVTVSIAKAQAGEKLTIDDAIHIAVATQLPAYNLRLVPKEEKNFGWAGIAMRTASEIFELWCCCNDKHNEELELLCGEFNVMVRRYCKCRVIMA